MRFFNLTRRRISRKLKVTTPTPHMKGDNPRQRETRPLQSQEADHTNQHQGRQV